MTTRWPGILLALAASCRVRVGVVAACEQDARHSNIPADVP
jgi:hypothetical protein